MALPSSGSISIAQVATELGLSLPLDLNDSRVRALAGKPTGNITLPNDLWGKSNGPTLSIGVNFYQETVSFNSVRDVATVTLNWTGSTAPTSYSWAWEGYSVSISGATSRTATFRGQNYNEFELGGEDNGYAVCTAVFNGVSYTASTYLTFKTNGFS